MNRWTLYKMSLSNTFRDVAKYVAPPLHKRLCEGKAREYTEKARLRDDDSFGRMISASLAKSFLNEAGHDTEKDDVYRNILGIKGGKQSFDDEFQIPLEPDEDLAAQPS